MGSLCSAPFKSSEINLIPPRPVCRNNLIAGADVHNENVLTRSRSFVRYSLVPRINVLKEERLAQKSRLSGQKRGNGGVER